MQDMKKSRISHLAAGFIAAVLLAVGLCGCSDQGAQVEVQTPEEQASYADSYYKRLENCVKLIDTITDFKPEIVLVLGTGLGNYVEALDVKATIPYAEIEGWPESTAPEHAGNLVLAERNGHKLAIMQGRLHYYEGYSMDEVVLPLRVLHMLGADTAILTNATGSLNPDFKAGEFVCVEDQISSFIPSPLIGENIDELGSRFVGMEVAFDEGMRDAVLKAGQENDIPVHSGVYLQVTGPQYETPAEIKMYRSLGADTIAMSMADEVLAARHMGMRVCAINCISNMAAGMEEEGFTEESIGESMGGASQELAVLVDALLDTL